MSRGNSQLGPAPVLLIGAALLVWGWQCQKLPYAILMALLIELSPVSPWRWAITDKEFNTLSDFSGVVFFLSVVYIFSDEGARGIFVILEVLPFILFPLLLVQQYSVTGDMKLSALFVSLRKLDPALSPEAKTRTNITLPYFIICLLAASTGNQRSILFFFMVATLLIYAIFSRRSKRYSIITWLATVALALSIAFATQHGLRSLQASIEASFLGIFDQFMWRYRDPSRATTAIGSLGRLKLSDRIVLRIKTREKLLKPLYLREASYSSFGHGIWNSQQSEFTVIDPARDKVWELNPGQESTGKMHVSTYMTREESVIPVPHGTNVIENVAAIEIAKNQFGAVLMDMREGWVQYDVKYGDAIYADSAPDSNDLSIINYYRKDFEKLAAELNLYSMSDTDKIKTVQDYFHNNFTYSLNPSQRYPRGRYMAKFLFKTKRGHCEYFATATALLLRTVGIPTRYAVGYSIDEYSALEGQYIARARDAHSWTLAHLHGEWTVIDTTPSVWSGQEAENASVFEPVLDLWAWLSYSWSVWQTDDGADEEEENYLIWLLIPLLAVLAWRVYFRERIKNSKQGVQNYQQIKRFGTNSSFYRLVQFLETSYRPRQAGETLGSWLNKLKPIISSDKLRMALTLHYRYRFDPAGLSSAELSKLDLIVHELLENKDLWIRQEDPNESINTAR
ncbi:MAG: hypothetical protein GKR93_07820 [Gammaproteobacteria bacterium]|nr:hypothetical protein [Gammaproteobacteria bacterium]